MINSPVIWIEFNVCVLAKKGAATQNLPANGASALETLYSCVGNTSPSVRERTDEWRQSTEGITVRGKHWHGGASGPRPRLHHSFQRTILHMDTLLCLC